MNAALIVRAESRFGIKGNLKSTQSLALSVLHTLVGLGPFVYAWRKVESVPGFRFKTCESCKSALTVVSKGSKGFEKLLKFPCRVED